MSSGIYSNGTPQVMSFIIGYMPFSYSLFDISGAVAHLFRAASGCVLRIKAELWEFYGRGGFLIYLNVVETSVDYRVFSRLPPMSISVLITQQLLELRSSPQHVLLKLMFVQVKVAPHAHSPLVYPKPASVSKSHFPPSLLWSCRLVDEIGYGGFAPK